MPKTYLLRHGQASFGAANYDKLSPLGHVQAARVGEYLRERGIRISAALCGTLVRHEETFAGVCKGLDYTPAVTSWAGLNEYDSHALIAAIRSEPLVFDGTSESYKEHFRILKTAIAAWMNRETTPRGMPSHAEFLEGVMSALTHIREKHAQADDCVLVVSSGGPISSAVAAILQAPALSSIELNLRIANASLTELAHTPKRHMLVGFNAVAQFDARPELLTYA
jgi:broad specificity phosphatase PhoE